MAERETVTGQSEAGRAPLPLGVPRVWRPGAKTVPLDRDEMLRYLGYHGQKIEPELAERIDAVAADAVTRTAPAGIWAVFPRGMAYDTPVKREHPVSANQTPVAAGHITLEGTALALTGRDIFRHLKDARYVAVLAVTLGMASEQLLRVLSSRTRSREPSLMLPAPPWWKAQPMRSTARLKPPPKPRAFPATHGSAPDTATFRSPFSPRCSPRSTPRDSVASPPRQPTYSCPPRASRPSSGSSKAIRTRRMQCALARAVAWHRDVRSALAARAAGRRGTRANTQGAHCR